MGDSVSYRLHDAAAPIWEACLKHPFVTGIGDGTLAVEKFRYFMLQDYLYLFDYARVFALGVVKARDPRLMRTFAANVDAILGGEMEIHRTYMARLGITEEQVFAVKPALDNLSYTNYMLSVASTGGPAEIVASILACSWSYAEIGQALAGIPGAAELRRMDPGLRLRFLCRHQPLPDRADGCAGRRRFRGTDGAADGYLRQLQPL